MSGILDDKEPHRAPTCWDSFDARVWAREFVAYSKAKPGLATDEGTMETWFASALLRGYEERRSEYQQYLMNDGRVVE